MATFTQGEAVLDALHALQQARKEFAKVTKEVAELRDGLI
jgi:phage-related minor tail protein